MINRNLQSSLNPERDLELLAPPNQDPSRRQYKSGYEQYFNSLPVLNTNDELIDNKVAYTKSVMQVLASKIIQEGLHNDLMKILNSNEFQRTIIGLSAPTINMKGGYKEGTELVVAHWGKGFTSPIHGHANGYMHEEILNGKILVNTYRRVHPEFDIVRLVKTEIITTGTFAAKYNKQDDSIFKRGNLIHNFTALEPSNTLHYLTEHTRDGRDNTFTPSYFEDEYKLDAFDVKRITGTDGMYLQPGDVALVRSTNVPEYGDHYIVITGHPVKKEHGIRPQEVAISAPLTSSLLDKYEVQNGLVLLKLGENAKTAFLQFHGITVDRKIVKLQTV